METKKTLLIGLEGGSWQIFGPLSEWGEMPNLAKLRAQGTWGELRASPPLNLAATWASLITGVNPGSHGILLPHQLSSTPAINLAGEGKMVSGEDVRAPLVWDYLSSRGIRIGSVNQPFTYPLRPIYSFALSGMFTPPQARDWAFPPSLTSTLQDYVIDLDIAPEDKTKAGANPTGLLNHILHMTERRGMHSLRLMRSHDWDVFAVVFTGVRRIFQHFWPYLSPQTSSPQPHLDIVIAEKLRMYFALVDQLLGALIKMAGPDTRILLYSPYGYRASARQKVHFNNWLLELGMLQLRSTSDAPPSHLHPPLPDLARRILPASARQALKRYGGLSAAIDWQKTQAWAMPLDANTAGIFLSPQAGQAARADLQNFLLEQARALRVPGKGEALVKNAWARDELYHGPHMELFPDIILSLDADYAAVAELGSTLIMPYAETDAQPDATGMILAAGPDIGPGHLAEPASILDVAPTIFQLLELPIPASFEGESLSL